MPRRAPPAKQQTPDSLPDCLPTTDARGRVTRRDASARRRLNLGRPHPLHASMGRQPAAAALQSWAGTMGGMMLQAADVLQKLGETRGETRDVKRAALLEAVRYSENIPFWEVPPKVVVAPLS